MRTTSIRILTLSLLSLFGTACGSSGSDAGHSPDSEVDSDEDDPTEDEPDEDDDAEADEPDDDLGPYADWERFEMPVDQTITVGAFDIHLDDAFVWVSDDSFKAPELVFEYEADNLKGAAEVPLLGTEITLQVGDRYISGYRNSSDKIPGGLTGENAFWWELDDPGLTREDVQNATVILGAGSQNQVIIPLATPEETVALNDVQLDPFEVAEIQAGHRADFTNNRIQFSSRGQNALLDKGTAWLILSGELFGGWNFSCLELEDMAITRPDGISIIAEAGRECIDDGEKKDIGVIFEIEEPYAGTYQIEFRASGDNDGEEDVTFEVVVPEKADE